MSDIRPQLKDFNDLKRRIRERPFREIFSLDLVSIYKAFTTDVQSTGLTPRYEPNILGASGVSIDSFLLNPYGRNTVNENVVAGDTIPINLNIDGDYLAAHAHQVRSFGIKTPMTYVGWGYDTFGYPAPNRDVSWGSGGVFHNSSPSESFGFRSTDDESILVNHGSDLPFDQWKSGPMDLRWDNHRKVWTMNYGVYTAIIEKAYNGVTEISDFSIPLDAPSITYNARIFDGVATGIRVTGVIPDIPRPDAGTYKVYPIPLNSPVLITHKRNVDGKPAFGLLAWEKPFAEDCATTTSETLISEGFLNIGDLETTPLSQAYGGTGYDSYVQYEILVGDDDGSLVKRSVTAGTGIVLNFSNPTGMIISLDPSISFVIQSGINTNITALSGLTTPITIAQGGTGFSTKSYVDLSTAQSAGGVKNFTSPIRLSSGSVGTPSISFFDNTSYGFYLTPNVGIGISTSGQLVQFIGLSGLTDYKARMVSPDNSYVPSLVVRSATNNLGSGVNKDIQQWQTPQGSPLSRMDSSGVLLPAAIKQSFVATTGAYSVGYTNYTVGCNTSHSGIVITLPSAIVVSGQEFCVKDIGNNASTNNISIATSPTGQLIDGIGHIKTLSTNLGSYRFISDGGNYWIV